MRVEVLEGRLTTTATSSRATGARAATASPTGPTPGRSAIFGARTFHASLTGHAVPGAGQPARRRRVRPLSAVIEGVNARRCSRTPRIGRRTTRLSASAPPPDRLPTSRGIAARRGRGNRNRTHAVSPWASSSTRAVAAIVLILCVLLRCLFQRSPPGR